jgi:phage shock protein C
MRLERSRTDSILFGLCGGLARSAGVSAGWIRFGMIAGTLFTGGTLFCVYVIASMLIPKETTGFSGGYWYVPADQAYAYGGAYAAGGFSAPAAASPSTVDSMMQRLEEQTMNREIQELRSKLAQYEQQH